ncbi:MULTISPECIES: hypothetical protein [unclassified Streptomyces]|uniref:hypothetical protein n=1 Tax=unclassified Streptomyces TaxID=2593676 RepID=UPI00081F10CE|nr:MULTISPECIES: hypothetical protein [unclassified Streptomyces]MYZ35469.1 hypothetical protein [Streptomyces sp. SID4917]SCF75733.1 hypothetical protein GA0115259_102122 [Streptomyces sp. MnatMP-M17]
MPTVTLNIFFASTPGTQTSCDVYRSADSNTGPWEYLQTIPLLSQSAVFFDTGAPLGVNVWYRVVGVPGTPSAQTFIAGPIQLNATSSVYAVDPLRPWASRAFDFCSTTQGHTCGNETPAFVWAGFGDRERAADITLLPLTGSETPADVFARRKDHTGSFQVLTRTLEAKEAIYDLFTYGGPVLLQLPPVYGQPDIYVQPGTIREAYISADQRRPYRLWTIPYTVVTAPVGPKQGTACANWCAVQEAYPTFADMTAAGGTWQAIATGDTVCGDPEDQAGYGDGLYGDGPYGD